MQVLLPQVVVGNEATLPAAKMASLRAACPANVRLLRQKSAWNNKFLCAVIIRILALALRPHRDRFQPVLILDACRLHFAEVVVNACNACGIWLVFVPAKATWLLQPLDTDAFLPFKSYLRKAYQKARIESGQADLDIGHFLGCLFEAIQRVLEAGLWAGVFDKVGFGMQQSFVAPHILRELVMEGPVGVPSSRPTSEQLQVIFPKRATIPETALWRPFETGPRPKAAPKAMASHASLASGVGSVPILRLGRTRLAHQRVVASEAAAASSSAEAKAAFPVVAVGRRLNWFRPKANAEVEGS